MRGILGRAFLQRMVPIMFMLTTNSAYATGQALVVDNHPSGDPNKTATGQSAILDANNPDIVPPDVGCSDFHLHGFYFGHADPAPLGCGHGIVVFLNDDEAADLTEAVQKQNLQNGYIHQFTDATNKNRVLYYKTKISGKNTHTTDNRNFWIDGSGVDGGNDDLNFGLSAGNEVINLGIWSSYSRTASGSDLSSIAFDSTTDNVMFGIDGLFRDYFVAGIGFGYETQDIETGFNSGTAEGDGFTVAPYAAYFINNNFSLDGSFGYSSLEIDDAFTPLGGTLTTSSRDADRWFVTANLNYLGQIKAAVFNISMGYLYINEDTDAYTDSTGTRFNSNTIELGQFSIEGDISYAMGPLEPYASIGYEYDVTHDDIKVAAGLAQPDNDRDGVRYGLGLRYFGNSGLSGILEWNMLGNREDFDSSTISLTGRLDF